MPKRSSVVSQVLAATVPLTERWELIRAVFLDRVWVGLLVIALTAAPVAGVLSVGLLGSAWWWMFNAALIVSMLHSTRAGLIHALIAAAIVAGAGVAFVNGWLTINFDANQYVLEYSSWLTVLLGPIMLTIFIFWAISTYQEAVQELLKEVDRRREQREELILQLQQALDEIKTLRGYIPICAHCKKIRDDAMQQKGLAASNSGPKSD